MRSQYLPLSSQNSFGHGGFESRHIQPVSTRQLKQPSPCTKFPSSHCSPKWGSNDPLPQVSFLQGWPSSGHAQPNSTDLQSAEQPSPSSSLPSSHASPELITPSPQRPANLQSAWQWPYSPVPPMGFPSSSTTVLPPSPSSHFSP